MRPLLAHRDARGRRGPHIENPGEIPVEYRAISEGDDVRAATDYIAGMTDRYAKSRFQNLFEPHSLHV